MDILIAGVETESRNYVSNVFKKAGYSGVNYHFTKDFEKTREKINSFQNQSGKNLDLLLLGVFFGHLNDVDSCVEFARVYSKIPSILLADERGGEIPKDFEKIHAPNLVCYFTEFELEKRNLIG